MSNPDKPNNLRRDVWDLIKFGAKALYKYGKKFQLADELEDQVKDCELDHFQIHEIRNNGYTAIMKKTVKPSFFRSKETQYMYVYMNQDRDVVAEMHGLYDPELQIRTSICSNPQCRNPMILTDNENNICSECSADIDSLETEIDD